METPHNYSLPQIINRNNLHNSYAKAEINITCARRDKRILRKIMWEFDLVDILKKFIKGFDLLLFGRTQHIGFFVDFCL